MITDTTTSTRVSEDASLVGVVCVYGSIFVSTGMKPLILVFHDILLDILGLVGLRYLHDNTGNLLLPVFLAVGLYVSLPYLFLGGVLGLHYL